MNAIGRPRAVYRDCTVDAVTADTVTVAGVTLKSRVLAAQLGGRRRLFACCATCGRETAELEESPDPLEQFWLEELRMELLRHASAALRREIMSRFGIPRLAGMAPGSGDAGVWPLQEQTKLFDGIFGGRIPELIGVEPDRFPADGPMQKHLGRSVCRGTRFRDLPALPSGELPRPAGSVRPGAMEQERT